MSDTRRTRPIHVLVAEPHPLTRKGLSDCISDQADMRLLATCASATEVVALYEVDRPDVVVTEARLGTVDACDLIAQLRGRDESARVLVFTAFDTPYEVYTCVRSGARGFLVKDATPDELVSAIRDVAAGSICLSPKAAAHVAERASATELSAREIEVLRRIADGDDNAEIARRLFVTLGTVKYHVANILRKLRARDRLHALAIAYRGGLIRP